MHSKKNTITNLLWTVGQQMGNQIVTFITSVILARLLQPSDFGLMGMMALLIGIGNVLVDAGLTNSLIRSKQLDERDYSTVFYINLIGAILIYIILYFVAPLISDFYRQPLLTNLIRAYSFSFIIVAFVGVQTTKLTKEMKFKLQMLMQIPSVIIGGIVGVYMAMNGFGVWSLVWMNLTNAFVFAALHWIYSDWKPKMIFDIERFKYHFNFGYKLTLSGVLDISFENIYNIVIGRIYSVVSLGFYTRAFSLQMLPVQSISAALNKVTFPLFASIQDDDQKLKEVYRLIMIQVLFWVTMIMVTLQAVGAPLFNILFTSKWAPAVPFFQILCVYGMLYPLHLYNLNILLVKGRSDLFLKLEIYKKIVTIIGIASVIPFGIYGLIYFQILFSVISFFINTFYSGRLINYSLKDQLKDILPIFIIAVVVSLSVWQFKKYFLSKYLLTDYPQLIIVGSICMLSFLGIAFLFKLKVISDTMKLIKK
ncbi:lipopolysaccharide biosynthesis protein [Pedobacter sp. GR22-10]|uniref:lipopolysaccharide biosynthesis protein n=1 Tax=Pedobacter sp. GR22-10 TaxID=2994472 RepID=UPI00224842FD|nr:lipopolysaccharide biosynthesis protein [Pedobacter sp. GR22-10]MCX2432357.1 lipopolysaccharide biosynthesis protein [Pedobacter sp. GR22-10]